MSCVELRDQDSKAIPSGGSMSHDIASDGFLVVTGVRTSRSVWRRHDLVGDNYRNPKLEPVK